MKSFNNVGDSPVIPRVLHICYSNIENVPTDIWKNLQKVSVGYDIRIYDDDRCRNYINQECGSNLTAVYDRIQTLDHKRDLFKYCVLFNEGGVYMDLKMVPWVNLEEVIDHSAHNRLYTCLGTRPHINQGILATYKKNNFLKTLVGDFVQANNTIIDTQLFKGMHNFNYFTDKFYFHLENLLGYEPSPGVNYIPVTAEHREAGSTRQMFILFEERKEVYPSDNGYHKEGPWQIFGGGSDLAGCSEQRLFTTRHKNFPW